jgi:hypothetical protein
VVMVIWDIGAQLLAVSSLRVWPRTSVPSTAPATRSASVAGTSSSAKRSSTRTLRIASPSRPAPAATAWTMSASASPAARPPEAISFA